MRIFKDGLRWDSEYNPIFEMISYKYVRFLRSGQTMSLYTSHTPKKVMNKIKQTMIKSQVGLGNKVYESWSGELQLICGTFDMFNDRIIVTDPINATDYRYDFQAFRKAQLPIYRQEDEGDHLMLDWQGFRIDENQISPGQIEILSQKLEHQYTKGSLEEFTDKRGFISFKFKSINEPRFKFVSVPEFDMPHNYYVNQLDLLTTGQNKQYKE